MESAVVILVVGLLLWVEWLLLRSVGDERYDPQVRRQLGSDEEHAEDGLGGDGVQGESSESTLSDLSGIC